MLLRILELEEAERTLLRRAAVDEMPLTEHMRARTRAVFGADLHPEEAVRVILRDVRQRGDAALVEWTHKLDGVLLTPEQITVPESEIAAVFDALDPGVVGAMERAAERIEAFHRQHPAQSWMTTQLGGMLGQIICPLERVGVYVPAGSAPLPSSLLMTAIVAKAAGVEEVIVCSPPQRGSHLPSPLILAAAGIADVDAVYAVGGVQAIGAMAYGTETIAAVDKICGPGNLFVVLAKKQVFGVCGIDALPGPTETLVIADDAANPIWVAADLLAQAEHRGGSALLLTPSRRLAEAVAQAVQEQVAALPEPNRSDVCDSLAHRSGAVICQDLNEAIALANRYAPEHLCLSVADPWAWVKHIRHAGGVFVGEHSYEVLGDYLAGPSHVMPTGGTARFTPPLNVLDFMRVMNVIALDRATAHELAPAAIKLAEAEGLHAHAHAARLRLEQH
ncbi:MAG: histidinol dehydrogenase [Thermoflexales bacterium]